MLLPDRFYEIALKIIGLAIMTISCIITFNLLELSKWWLVIPIWLETLIIANLFLTGFNFNISIDCWSATDWLSMVISTIAISMAIILTIGILTITQIASGIAGLLYLGLTVMLIQSNQTKAIHI